jgi:hypothetical protein
MEAITMDEFYNEYFEPMNNWSEDQIRNWLIGGLKYNTFQPIPITIRDYPYEGLLDFCHFIKNKYGLKGEMLLDKIVKQIVSLFINYDYRPNYTDKRTLNLELDFFTNLIYLVDEFRLIGPEQPDKKDSYLIPISDVIHKFEGNLFQDKYDSNENEINHELISVSKKTNPKSLIDQKVSYINMRSSKI